MSSLTLAERGDRCRLFLVACLAAGQAHFNPEDPVTRDFICDIDSYRWWQNQSNEVLGLLDTLATHENLKAAGGSGMRENGGHVTSGIKSLSTAALYMMKARAGAYGRTLVHLNGDKLAVGEHEVRHPRGIRNQPWVTTLYRECVDELLFKLLAQAALKTEE